MPIPGTCKLTRLDEIPGGASLQLLADEVWRISDTTAAIEVHGARYSEASQRMINR